MNHLKRLFFEQTLRHWHFKELVKISGLSRERVNYYLKQLQKEHFIQHIKPKGKMPYSLANYQSNNFRLEKRLYGLNLLQQSGLFAHLLALKNVRTAILFGSFARGDWNQSSDVDIFLYGENSLFEKGVFEMKLRKELQIFSFQQASEIKKTLEPAILRNIAKGFNIKGDLEPFEVDIRA